MKVLVLSHMYPSTANEVSGIFVHEQVKALVEKGVDVRVVSPVPWAPFPVNRMSQKWKAYSRIPARSVWDGIKVSYPRYLAFPKGWFFASSGKHMYQGIKKVVAEIYREFPFDLIHAHVALPDGYAAMLVANKLAKPFVVTIHGADAYVTVSRNRQCHEGVSKVVEAAARVIVVSERLKQVLGKKLGEVKNNMTVIYNGVSLSKAYPGQVSKTDSSKILLSLGYLIERKGHRYVLEAVAQLLPRYPELRYLIAGSGPLRPDLEALTRKLGIQSNVQFLGFVPNKDLPRLLSLCDIFVLPSWDEAFGVVYLEAMLNGKPVIGCQGEGPEDFVEHGKTGLLVKPRNVESLIEALDFLLSHPDEAKAMGERAREVVLANYTWEKNAEKTIAVYREVLNER
jgi:glycosyltransferase involved in cell wall biosynthesis